MSLSLTFRSIALVLLLFPVLASGATPEQVETAVTKAKQWLYAKQQNGNWETVATPNDDAKSPDGGNWSGTTALVTFAMLAGGENAQDPRIKEAGELLLKAQTRGVYCVGIRCQALALLPKSKQVMAALQRDANILLAEAKPNAGYWYSKKPFDIYDHSISQFALLGLAACSDAGIEVPDEYWAAADRMWRADQLPDGSWNYRNKGSGGELNPTSSMTAAGVASLFLLRSRILQGGDCRGNLKDDAINSGISWLSKNYQSVYEPNWLGGMASYTLFGISRIGQAGGYKYLDGQDWFKTGTDFLVRTQNPDGSWPAGYCGPVADTAFSLLFLARGRAPVVINKAAYAAADPNVPAPWNQRPGDVANFTHWMSQETEAALNWQSVDLNVAPASELHDAPILLIAGNAALGLSPQVEAKLRQFCEEGGLIVGNADCGNETFATSFKKLGSRLFPYEFRALPDDHVIYKNEMFSTQKWNPKPKILGLTNGVRELMLLFPTKDPSRAWQVQLRPVHAESHQVMVDIVLYAGGPDLNVKGKTYLVSPDANKAARQIQIARVDTGNLWDPEPAGWRRLAAIMHNRDNIDLQTVPVKLGEGKLSGMKIAHLTGVAQFKLANPELEELKKFVQDGGTLIVDSAGGSSTFAESAESTLQAMFGDSSLVNLPDEHAIYTDGHVPFKELHFRRFARSRLGNTHTPQIKGLTIGSRTAVFYSAYDLSAGLVGMPVDGIVGYEPASATALMEQMILYASPTKPAEQRSGRLDSVVIGDLHSVLAPADKVVGVKQTAKGKPNVLGAPGDYGGSEGNDESPVSAIDGDTNTKYYNHSVDGTQTPGVNTGLVVTPTAGPTIVTAIQFAAANDLEGRDPLKITLEGSNDPKATDAGAKDFTVIYEGPSGLEPDPGRNTFGKVITFENKVAYKSYRLLITATRATDADSTQYAEVKLLGKAAPANQP